MHAGTARRRPASRRRTALAIAAFATCVAAVPAVAGITPADGAAPASRGTPRTVGEPPPPPVHRRVVFLSDSALAGIRWSGNLSQLTNAPWDAHLESCRRLVYPSCNGREGYRPRTVVSEIAAHEARHGAAVPSDILIIGTGYNDWESRFRDDFRAVIDTARANGFHQIKWLTYRDSTAYRLPGDSQAAFTNYAEMNRILDEELATGQYPDVELWDYRGFTADHPEWFTYDGVHLRSAGAVAVAQWLSSFFVAQPPS